MVAFATFAFAGEGETIKAYSVLAAGVGLSIVTGKQIGRAHV